MISVCIPAFNAKQYISEALDSILAQTYPQVEIIVVDDGSTDGTSDILRFYSERAKIIKKRNRGASSARNTAFEASTGSHVMFMDADDVVCPTHLADLAARIGDANTIVSSSWARFYVNPAEAKFTERYITADVRGVDWLVESWKESLPMTQPGMFLIPRKFLERYGGWDESLGLIDDFEFFSRIISKCRQVRFAPNARLYYRSGVPGSLSSQKSRKAVESQYRSLLLGTGHLLAAEDSIETRLASANVLKAFDYEHYPRHADLRDQIRVRVDQLGGANITPSGPPGFHKLRAYIGWRAARRVQHAAERLGLNGVARRKAI